MSVLKGLVGAMLGLLLAACGVGTSSDEAPDPAGTGLCFEQNCIKEQLVDLPQLENLHFTPGGRLFVSGQDNLYEITRAADGSFQATALFAGSAGCSGMSSRAELLYALCQSGSGPTDFSGLVALDLTHGAARPEPIFTLSGMTLPNGMVLAADGHLYVTDGPIAAEPKIVRLRIDPADPRHVLGQDTWLALPLDYPNGLTLRGRELVTTLYGPALGQVAAIALGDDGSAGPLTRVHDRGRIMDDLSAHGDTLLVTDWQDGRVFQLDADGRLLRQTPPGTFAQPSAVEVGRPPMFRGDELLVTERYTGSGLWRLAPRR